MNANNQNTYLQSRNKLVRAAKRESKTKRPIQVINAGCAECGHGADCSQICAKCPK